MSATTISAMRLPTRYKERPPLRFNITPLIDVVFLLIIFFLVASHFVRNDQAQAVELPLATAGEEDREQAPHRLTVTIDRDGNYFIAAEPQDEDTVKQRITELRAAASDARVQPEVRLRGHRDADYGSMRKIVEHCAAHNIRSIRFAVAVSGEQ